MFASYMIQFMVSTMQFGDDVLADGQKLEQVKKYLTPQMIGILYVVIFTFFLFATKASRSNRLFVIVLLFPMACYILIWVFVSKENLQFDKKLIWFVAIVLRLIMLFFPIGLSDDIYRYIWDGRVQHAGYNPFEYAPDTPELKELRDGGWTLINHKEISTPYPSGSQIVFFLLTSFTSDLGGTILIFRLTMIFFDFGVMYLLQELLQIYDKSNQYLIIYAWSPLVILEIAGNAHNDIIAVFFLILAIYLSLQSDKSNYYSLFSSASIILAVFVKIFPVIAVPFLIKNWRLPEFSVMSLLSIGLIFPYYRSGINPIYPEGQRIFVMYFRFNESLFRIYEFVIQTFTGNKVVTRYFYILVMIIFALILTYRYYTVKRSINKITHFIVLFGFIGLLLGPDVQPWYVIWIFPLAVLIEDKAYIFFSITVLLSYNIYPDYDTFGIWKENYLILIIEYLPVYLLLIYQLIKRFYGFKHQETIM